MRAPRPTDGKKYLGRAVGDAGPYGGFVGADAPVRPVRRLLRVRRGGALPRPRATARVAPTEGYKRLCGAGRCGERTERCQWQRKRSERVAAVKISSVRRKAAWKFWAPQQDHRPLRRGSGNSSVIGRGRTTPLRMETRFAVQVRADGFDFWGSEFSGGQVAEFDLDAFIGGGFGGFLQELFPIFI